jgi:hydrogenase-4 component B
LGGLLRAPLSVIDGARFDGGVSLDATLAPLAWVSGLSLAAIGVIGGLFALRSRWSPPEPAAGRQPTWGCGYSSPTPRMQYTGSSYVWNLSGSFHALLRSRRHWTPSGGSFAAPSNLTTETADLAAQSAYRPAFVALARQCARLWPLQHGRIQLYLMYIVATLLLVFAVEGWFSPSSSGRRNEPTTSAAALQREGALPPGPEKGALVP